MGGMWMSRTARPGRLDQIVGGYPARLLGLTAMSEYVNVYVDGRRLVTDAPAPGEILGYGPGRVVFARRMPGQAGYRLTEYAWKPTLTKRGLLVLEAAGLRGPPIDAPRPRV